MTWNLPPPPGFQGLRDDLPVHFYVRHLPHWRQDGATYFVTFRLADSLPQSKLRQLAEMRSCWEKELEVDNALFKGRFDRSILQQKYDQLSQQVVRQVERWLDQGMGSCVLRRSEISRKVCDALHYFDGDRYELGAYVVMPNHVHLLMRPLQPQTDSLETILQSRKRYTAQSINRFLGRSGTLWQDESLDRIVRDEEHLWRCLQYISRNPELAELSREDCPRWIQPSWRELGWVFEDLLP